MRGEETAYIRWTYNGKTTDSATFTVKSECPAITANHGSLSSPSLEIAPVTWANAKKQIITNNYVTNPSTHKECLISYTILDATTSNPMQPLGGNWVITDTNGHVHLDINYPDKKTFKIRYVHLLNQVEIPAASVLTAEVKCPAISFT